MIDLMERRDIQSSLNNVVQRVTGQMEQLAEIEDRIETKKSGDPFVKKMDEIARQLARAQAEGDLNTVRQLAETHAADLQKYQTWRRSIQPDVEAALFCRVALLQEQRRIYKYHGDFLLRAINARLTVSANEAVQEAEKNASIAEMIKTSSSLSARWDEMNAHSLSVGVLRGKGIDEQSTLLGEEIERIRELASEIEDLNQSVSGESVVQSESDSSDESRTRMAFMTRDRE